MPLFQRCQFIDRINAGKQSWHFYAPTVIQTLSGKQQASFRVDSVRCMGTDKYLAHTPESHNDIT